MGESQLGKPFAMDLIHLGEAVIGTRVRPGETAGFFPEDRKERRELLERPAYFQGQRSPFETGEARIETGQLFSQI
jgi:hypothetical protein